jgi:hypothetical protein
VFLLELLEFPLLEMPATDVALPPVAVDDAPDVLFDALVLLVLGAVGGAGVVGGTTLHSYSKPLNSASCPSASP